MCMTKRLITNWQFLTLWFFFSALTMTFADETGESITIEMGPSVTPVFTRTIWPPDATATAEQQSLVPPDGARSLVEKKARKAILALKKRNMLALSRLIHPSKGLRFSAFTGVNDKEPLIPADQVAKLLRSDNKFASEPKGASGDDEDLTFSQYYKKYIYDRDFANVEQVTFNQNRPMGTIRSNIHQFYPDSIAVEYFSPSPDLGHLGNNWKVLTLVFQKANDNEWYLVGIVHNEWTI